jgi:hypothetical protein
MLGAGTAFAAGLATGFVAGLWTEFVPETDGPFIAGAAGVAVVLVGSACAWSASQHARVIREVVIRRDLFMVILKVILMLYLSTKMTGPAAVFTKAKKVSSGAYFPRLSRCRSFLFGPLSYELLGQCGEQKAPSGESLET